ncbi:BMC domain-containing protein [Anaerocolumna cellulosilytica]|uniref:BMC domain-containing protein n=1 Tax=Anaerocolumna cellulosilytica TaxID=433286 RepID=A0A6S6R7I8_9FIRM|nr:BMC domain-containing protein [Anaerocolumna cellulosilytica]MBB5193806.1 energy-coupling factor transport system substrate-specific component [Anaerocolumna cellulosilytica]BCJ94978.1 BMC domain-containing protein [Anaerocolumna cellulosilytica]
MKALGMIEVYGYLTAVAALDSALKAADVHLLDLTLVKGGYVTVLITGDVGAVKAAIDASSSYAKNLGTVLSVHVIPRPEDSVEEMLRQVKGGKEKEELGTLEVKNDQKRNSETENSRLQTEYAKEVLEGMTVESLRNLARKLGITNLTRKEIKYANKKQLIESIRSFLEQER